MIVCIRGEVESEGSTPTSCQVISGAKRSMAEVLLPEGSPAMDIGKHVVIVMDALREFSWGPLQWVLDHVIQAGYTITLLGVMPYLPLPLSCKTWLDVWTFGLEDLSALKGRSEWKYDHKYHKIRGILELCEQKGVVAGMKVAMGHPLRLVVLEQTTSLHATCVVIDRHLRRNKAFFAERLPSSVVLMNSDGGVDMLRNKSTMDQSDLLASAESPANLLPTPQVILSQEVSQLFKGEVHGVEKQELGDVN